MNRDLHIDNRSLVEECLKGDREALSLFYTRFAPKMLALIRRYVSDPMDAEDILHDGFIVAFTRLRTLRDYDHADYWLATIMKNLALQFLHLQDVGAMLHEIPEIADTPSIDEFLDIETLESLIKELPAGYQKVFRLAVLEKKSHKEIARILGISPSSSSSQFFRARMMMQRLIKDYRAQTGALILILASIPVGIYLIPADKEAITDGANTSTPLSRDSSALTKPNHPMRLAVAATPSAGMPAAKTMPTVTAGTASTATDSILAETQEVQEVQESPTPPGDKTAPEEEQPTPVPESHYHDDYPLYAEIPPAITGSQKTEGWTFGFGVNPGIANFNAEWSTAGNDMSPGYDPPLGGGDYTGPGEDGDNPDIGTPIIPPADSGSPFGNYNTTPHHNSMPVSASLLVSRGITGGLSAETGLTYTYLHTEFEGTRSTADCRWHYIGIPFKLKLKFNTSQRLSFYGAAGGAVDFPVYSSASVHMKKGVPELTGGRFSSPVSWSLSAGLGAAIKLSDHLEIFLEPTLQFRFDHDYTVPNVWTDDPVGFSLPIGLRFNM